MKKTNVKHFELTAQLFSCYLFSALNAVLTMEKFLFVPSLYIFFDDLVSLVFSTSDHVFMVQLPVTISTLLYVKRRMNFLVFQ